MLRVLPRLGLLAHLDLGAVHDILDVGCGAGVLLERLRQRLPLVRLAGIDVSASMVETGVRAAYACLRAATRSTMPHLERATCSISTSASAR